MASHGSSNVASPTSRLRNKQKAASFSPVEEAKQRHDQATEDLKKWRTILAGRREVILKSVGFNVEDKKVVQNHLNLPHVVSALAECLTKIEQLGKAEQEAAIVLQRARGDEEANKKRAHSVAPSSLTPENLHLDRGELKIHDRDSGVARYAAFLAVLQSLSQTSWEEKKKLLIKNCSEFFRESAASTKPAAEPEDNSNRLVDIDSQVQGLLDSIRMAVLRNQGSGTLESQEGVFSEQITFFLNCFSACCKLPLYFAHQYPTAASSRSVHFGDIAIFSLGQLEYQCKLLEFIKVKRGASVNTQWQLCGYASEKFAKEKLPLSFFLSIDHQLIY